jgi:hypothetical protein
LVDDDDTVEAAKAFRAGLGPIAIAVLANLVLGALCLGVPYYRGHIQAQASLRAFSSFAACLLDAKAQSSLGLGMPVGEREHFASQMMRGPADWPGRCREALRAVAPEEAIFLWPSVKQAGGDVRTVVRLVDAELTALGRARRLEPPGRVPGRPLLAFAKLRAVLSLFARATNADAEIDRNVIVFAKPAALAEPARLPIVAGSSAALEVWAGQDGLYATAIDGRGLSWLHVEGGKIDHRRFKRTSQMRAALREGETPLLVWAMSKARCEQEANRCVRRATGVARFDEGAEQLPSPLWLGGHPAGRPDRSLRLSIDDRLDLLARSDAAGALEVRRFKLERPEQDDAPPVAPITRFAVPATAPPADALLLQGQPGSVVYLVTSQAGLEAWLWRYETAEAPRSLGTVAGTGAFIAACEAEGGTRFIAFGTQTELSLASVASDGQASPLLTAAPIALGEALHPEDGGHDRLRMLCGAQSATLVAATRERALLALRCNAGRCERGPELAREVATFDAALAGDTTLVAYSRSAQPQVVVVRLDARGQPLAAGQTPAACWDPQSGMCGQPTLVADAGRLLLCARDGSDLLALESEDGGEHWKSLSGLKVSGAINTDVSAPMQQHRLRKGLD